MKGFDGKTISQYVKLNANHNKLDFYNKNPDRNRNASQEIREEYRLYQESIGSEWIENDELSRLLSLSKHQLKGYRGRGLLGYTMIGNKIYYKRREVERFIKRHINK